MDDARIRRLAEEVMAELDLVVSPDTLRRWLLSEGLWHKRLPKRIV